jgi:alpha-glucosidase (family GH31 glycosyl hydrolase)
MATFCPIMQFHSEHSDGLYPKRDRSPWNIAECTGDPWVLPVCRFYTELTRRLSLYILQEAAHMAATGRPLMCAQPLASPDDALCSAYPYQYLFGRDVLVCPTVEPGIARQRIYLPPGL